MKVKTKLSLILILACACVAAFVAGCTVGDSSVDDRLKEYNVKVTYFANGGSFKGGAFTQKTLYYRPGSPIYEVGVTVDSNPDVYLDNRDGFILEGWYFAEVDEDGNFIKQTQEKVNFKTLSIEENGHKYVCAVWAQDIRLPVKLVYDGTGKVATNDAEYANGDVISHINFNADGVANVSNANAPILCNNATFLEYFADEQCTQPFSGAVQKPAGDEEPAPVYAKYISGVWTLIRSVADVGRMFQQNTFSSDYYFYTSEKQIDCKSLSPITRGDTNVRIEGNGCTLKNLKFTGNVASRNGSYSIFGKLGVKCEIKNLTFDGVEINFTTRNSGYIHALCNGGEATSKFKNVTFKNFKLNITTSNSNVQINNIPAFGGGYNTDSWICGGNMTDAEFIAGQGLTVSAGELYYGGTKIAQTN